jgi:hypothetical protein
LFFSREVHESIASSLQWHWSDVANGVANLLPNCFGQSLAKRAGAAGCLRLSSSPLLETPTRRSGKKTRRDTTAIELFVAAISHAKLDEFAAGLVP